MGIIRTIAKKIQKLVDDYKRKQTTYTPTKSYGSDAYGYNTGTLKFNTIDQSQQYTEQQKQKALDNMYSKVINDPTNISLIEKDLKKTYGTKYDKTRHYGIKVSQGDGKWYVESYYTPKTETGESDQPWYSTFETDNPFNPSYFKYKYGGVV